LKRVPMTRTTFAKALATVGTVTLTILTLTGCHTDMWVQPKPKVQGESDFFKDDQSNRPLVPFTVDRNHLKLDQEFYTGFTGGRLANGALVDAQIVDKIPTRAFQAFENNPEKMLLRGRERFDIFCSPCHGRIGDGQGMIAQRGFSQRRPPGNYHTDRLRKMPIGHFFDVMTNGYGVMYSYASRVEPEDRWAIAAYIRALQMSQDAQAADLRPDDMQKIEEAKSVPEPIGSGTEKK
jgi:mono/diheme cytochrome c family protein